MARSGLSSNVNWILYSIGHLHEIGNELPSLFSQGGFIESFTWFFLGFWLNFFAFFFSSRGLFGDVALGGKKLFQSLVE